MTELKGDYFFFGFTSTSAVLTKKRCPLLTTFYWNTSSRARNQSRPGLDIPFYHIVGTMLTQSHTRIMHWTEHPDWLVERFGELIRDCYTVDELHRLAWNEIRELPRNSCMGIHPLECRLWRRTRCVGCEEECGSGGWVGMGGWAEWQRIEWASSQLQCPLCITGNVWLEIVFLDHRLQYREVCNKSLHGGMHRCQLTVFSVCPWIAGSTTCLWAGAPLCYDSIMKSQTYWRATYVLHPTTQRILWPYNYRVPEERLISMILIFEERTTRSLW